MCKVSLLPLSYIYFQAICPSVPENSFQFHLYIILKIFCINKCICIHFFWLYYKSTTCGKKSLHPAHISSEYFYKCYPIYLVTCSNEMSFYLKKSLILKLSVNFEAFNHIISLCPICIPYPKFLTHFIILRLHLFFFCFKFQTRVYNLSFKTLS